MPKYRLLVLIVFFISTIYSSVFANMNAWNFFSQGSAPDSENITKSANISILSEKLSVEFSRKEEILASSSIPSFHSYFIDRGMKIPGVMRHPGTGSGMFTSLYGSSVDENTGFYYSGENKVNAHVTATYVMRNTSRGSLSIDSGFSFFDRMSSNQAEYDPGCSDYVIIEDGLLPKNFSIMSDKKVIPSNLEYISKPGTTRCYLSNDEVDRSHPTKWMLPVERYTLDFKQNETKVITVRYSIHSFKAGTEYYYSDAVFYDFAPIFSWGKGKIPKVDIDLVFPREHPAVFSFAESYTGAREKVEGYNDHILNHGMGYTGSQSPAFVKPDKMGLLSDNRVRQSYSIKNLQKTSGMDTLLFTFTDLMAFRAMNASFGNTSYGETFGLQCVLPDKTKRIFKNLFPGEKPKKGGEFIGYEYLDTGKGIMVTTIALPDEGLSIDSSSVFVGKTTILPSGTNCQPY